RAVRLRGTPAPPAAAGTPPLPERPAGEAQADRQGKHGAGVAELLRVHARRFPVRTTAPPSWRGAIFSTVSGSSVRHSQPPPQPGPLGRQAHAPIASRSRYA